MTGAGGRPFEAFDVSVLAAEDHLWLSAHSAQGSVYAVPRHKPTVAELTPGVSPTEWLKVAVGHARTDAFDEARHLGQQLTDLAFGVPEVSTLFQQTRGVAASRGAQVLVRLLAAPQEISAWPWELMLDPQQPERFLAWARDVHVIRAGRSRTYPVRAAPIAPPLNVLLVMSSPLQEGTIDAEAQFDLYEEKRVLLAELTPLVQRGLLRVEVEDRPSVERLRSRMNQQRRGFHIVHYLGHAQPGGLKLEQPGGRGRIVASEDFSLLLQQMPDLRLAVFAGCETARAPESTIDQRMAWPGGLSTADYCVRDACPMVVGMQAVLPFGTERVFTRYFYQALTAGQSVAEGLRLARLAIADDEHAGGQLLNWAVPCLIVGGSEPGPLLDPEVRAVPIAPVRRNGQRLGLRQGELRFISRLAELRVGVDVLSGRSPDARLLMITGLRGTGKTAFADRVIEELGEDVAYLFVTGDRLFAEEDPLAFLCERLADVLNRTRRRAPAQGRDAASVWWERLLEDLTETPLALVIDDADSLRGDDQRSVAVRDALIALAKRRGRTRVALVAREELSAITQALHAEQVRRIGLKALSWAEVWQWIRRNLPVLTRVGEAELSAFYTDLPRLEDWEQLAESVTSAGSALATIGDLAPLVRRVAGQLTSPRPAVAPPVFGAVATPTTEPSGAAKTLRVAVAGPYTAGRADEFARGITQFAAAHGASGRVGTSTSADTTSRLAELVPLESPFDAAGTRSDGTLERWVERARDALADVILLDFGSPHPNPRWDRLTGDLLAMNRLVIAAGGNSGQTTYPGAYRAALAVGALGADGKPASYSGYERASDKPELYAPETLAGSPLAEVAADPALRGTSLAALHVVAAATVVWSTDRGLTALDVRSILIETAAPLGTAGRKGPRRLDVAAALTRTRCQLLLDTLERGPMRLQELLAESGLRPELALPILDQLAASGDVHRVTAGGEDRYENPNAVYLAYERLRSAMPASAARTTQLDALVLRVQMLAKRGRYQPDEVAAMWASGQEGRRVSALGAIEADPQLGTAAIVLEGVTGSLTAFEQFQAFVAATRFLDRFSADEREQLRTAIETELGASGHIRQDTSRRRVAQNLLKLLTPAANDDGAGATATAAGGGTGTADEPAPKGRRRAKRGEGAPVDKRGGGR